jgi:beta-galactosidase
MIKLLATCFLALMGTVHSSVSTDVGSQRTRVLINDDWRFIKGDHQNNNVSLLYAVVQSWILPTGNDFLKDPAKRAKRPEGNLGDDVTYVASGYDDTSWQKVDLPHDYAVEGPFTDAVSGSTGRLPASGVVWYRKDVTLPASDAGKSIFLDIDGAMAYSMVWLNGRFVGGWPYGYASFRLDLTPFAEPGANNVLVNRLDNPVPKDTDWRSASSRWYPGGGLFRNVWLVKTGPTHVGQWGTYITTPEVSKTLARVNLRISDQH